MATNENPWYDSLPNIDDIKQIIVQPNSIKLINYYSKPRISQATF